MENDERHYSESFLLYSSNKINLETPNKLFKRLEQTLKKIFSINRCPNCCGLLPEVNFEFEGVMYFFTCHKVEKEGKIIAETDYSKLVDYHQNP